MSVLISDSHCHVMLVEFDDNQQEEQHEENLTQHKTLNSEMTDNASENTDKVVINMSNLVVCGTHPCLDWELVSSLYNKTVFMRTITNSLDQKEMEEFQQEHLKFNNVAELEEQNAKNSKVKHVIIGFGVHPWYIPEITALSNTKEAELEKEVSNHVENNNRTLVNANAKLCTESALTSLNLETLLAELEEKLKQYPHAIVGEIGLDKLKGPSQQAQEQAFIAQLELASRYNRPISIHCVRQYGLLLSLLSEFTSTKKMKKSSSSSLTSIKHMPPSIIIHAFTGSAEIAESLLRLASPHTNCRIYFGVGANTSLRVKNFISHTLPLLLERHKEEPCILLESDAFYVLHKTKENDTVNHDNSISTSSLHLSISDKDAFSWQRFIHAIMPLYKGDLSNIEHAFARAFQSVLLK